MVVAGNDPLESFSNSIQVVKNSFFELNFGNVAKNFEHCFNGFVKNGSFNVAGGGNDFNQVATQLHVKKSGVHVVKNGDDRKRGKVPKNVLFRMSAEKCGSNDNDNFSDGVEKVSVNLSNKWSEETSNKNYLCLEVALSFLINGLIRAFPNVLKAEKKGVQMISDDDSLSKKLKVNEEGKHLSFECLVGSVFDQLSHFPKFDDVGVKARESVDQFDHFKAITGILEGKKADVNGFLRNLNFARVGGVPSSIVEVPSVKEVDEEGISGNKEDSEANNNSPKKFGNALLSVPLSNVERLRSTLSTVSLTELIELLPQIGRPSKEDHPDKKKLFSVQDFFRYTEAEGKRFFQELDRDGDGNVTMEDLEFAMRKRKLPKRYAYEFMWRARSHLFSRSFGWKQFLSLMEQKEPTILRAYTSLCLNKSGTIQKSEILASLKNAGLPSNEDNAVAMMRFLNDDTEESISYGHFRNFMLLLPSDRLQEDPRSIWFEAATLVAAPPPVEIPTGSVLKSALAGGLSCALSTSLMYPIDTVKTRVQASTLSFPEILSTIPHLGARGLYRGSIPAILGQFSSHGLRTGLFEASKLVLINVAPTLPEIQVQSAATFCSTFLGTAIRIPCEVLKQRLQAGLFDNVGEAIVGTWQQDGLKGFFRGTAATLCREVPFYVAGMCIYGESKKAAQKFLGRELEPWETIAVGALSGGLGAVLTTPFDVIKTRTMTAPQGRPISLPIVALSILSHEGPIGLFKGAIPRFFWIAPLGAMNFAGYELARKAMVKNEESTEQLVQK